MFRRRLTAVVLFAAILTVAGCASRNETGAATGAVETPAQALPPVMAQLSVLDGETFQINEKQPLVINVGEAPVDSLSLVSMDPEGIAEFTPGKTDGSAQYNPSITAITQGETTVVLSEASDTARKITFTVQVVPAP